MLAFHLTPQAAVLFFEICEEFNADTEEKRLQIMQALAEYGLIDNIVQTPQTKEEYMKHLAKNFKVLEIKQEKPNDTDSPR